MNAHDKNTLTLTHPLHSPAPITHIHIPPTVTPKKHKPCSACRELPACMNEVKLHPHYNIIISI